MKWKTHRQITRMVCSRFSTHQEEIAEASTLPDKEPDYVYRAGYRGRVYRTRVAHHGREAMDMAFSYLKKARKAYLRGDGGYVEYLGRALHYIQDYSVDPTEKLWIFQYRSGEAHDDRESCVAGLEVPESAIQYGLRQECTPLRVRQIILGAAGKRNPADIMFLATYLSTVAAKSVYAPDRPPGLEENYSKALKIHAALVLLPFSLLIAGISPLTVLSALLLSPVLHFLDFNYRRRKLEYEWFRP